MNEPAGYSFSFLLSKMEKTIKFLKAPQTMLRQSLTSPGLLVLNFFLAIQTQTNKTSAQAWAKEKEKEKGVHLHEQNH